MIRLAMAMNGQDFKDTRMSHEEWFSDHKPKLMADVCNPQAPYMIMEDGSRHSQSLALLNYAIEKYNNGTFMVMKDMSPEVVRDSFAAVMNAESIFDELMPVFKEQDEEKKKALFEEVSTSKMPSLFSRLDSFVKRCKGGKNSTYMFGEKPCFADLALATYLSSMKESTERMYIPGIEKNCPTLNAMAESIENMDCVKTYRASHKQ